MDSKPASFSLSDLAIFDEAHLREVISCATGAVPPAVIGCALSADQPSWQASLAPLANRIERVLACNDRAAFAQALQQPSTTTAREAARRFVLERLFWELVYWKTPDDYERLTAGEQVHLGALDVARVDGMVVLDAGAGAGRLTLPLARRARRVYAMDAAPPLLRLLEQKLASGSVRNVELLRGVFRRLPLPDDSVDVAIACSAFGAQEVRGGECGLAELLRVTRPGGRIVILWPENPAWFGRHGFHYTTLPGHLTITFPSLEEAYAIAARFYDPGITRYLATTQRPEIPFAVLGVKPPRDLCWLTVSNK